MKYVLKAVALLAAASAVAGLSFEDVVADEWEEWKLFHERSYKSSVEERFRMKIFMENKVRISRHNRHAHRGTKDFFLEMNHYGDMLPQEFRSRFNGYSHGLKMRTAAFGNVTTGATFISPANLDLPDHVDWRELGAVTPVKDQGQCGSCWAFSSTGSLEGQTFRKSGKLVSLSEQNLVDCSRKHGNNGCNGGLMDFAFQYIKDNEGIDTEDSYPYGAKDDKCRFNKANVGAVDVGFVDIEAGNEQKLMEAVASVGPVSVALDASRDSFMFYSSGVYSDELCSADHIDHGVLLVGYGEEDGKKYWLVKNSWGEKWGESGYIRILRDGGNMCGIASAASYPLV